MYFFFFERVLVESIIKIMFELSLIMYFILGGREVYMSVVFKVYVSRNNS